MICALTGQPLPERTEGTRGRPRKYISDDARLVANRLSEVEVLLRRVRDDMRFTEEAAEAFEDWMAHLAALPR